MAGVEIVAECANGFEAVKAVSELAPDLLFLDVQMPKLDGFEVLELVGRDVPVVFVTAYDEFALRAFEVHAVDYLLKPFRASGWPRRSARARARQDAEAGAGGAARERRGRPGAPLERVVIRDGAQVHVMPVEKIDYVEAQDDYVAFRTGGQLAAQGADARRTSRRSSIRGGSCASTGRICSTSSGWRGSSCTPRTAASRS